MVGQMDCWSVSWSAGRSAGRSVGRSVGLSVRRSPIFLKGNFRQIESSKVKAGHVELNKVQSSHIRSNCVTRVNKKVLLKSLLKVNKSPYIKSIK